MRGLGCWLLVGWLAVLGCGDRSRILGPLRHILTEQKNDLRALVDSGSHEPRFVIETRAGEVTLSLPGYTMAIRYRDYFGIASLKMAEQRADFAHQELPLGDWEWFKIGLDNKQQWLKLIRSWWDDPVIEEHGDLVVLRFQRGGAIAAGIILGVEYRIKIDRPEFDIQYSIRNFSDRTLMAPYVMLGFPGFSNHGQVSAIETALDHRVPAPPHDNFRDEAIAVGKDEYLLLRHDVYPRLNPRDILKGVVSIAEEGRVFSLESSFDPDGTYTHVYSAHTNKPRYLTSHAYVYLANIPRGQERDLTIHYTLSSAALSNP